MRISILTTITNPDQRQDTWKEALRCYLDLADEVVVVNGGEPLGVDILDYLVEKPTKQGFEYDLVHKVKEVMMPWPQDWNWLELPRHLNAGREKCTGNWIIKLDIDQMFHEKDFLAIRKQLALCPDNVMVATFQKMTLTYGNKYYQKGEQPIAFRNYPNIEIGKNIEKTTDLCFAIRRTGEVILYEHDEVFYKLPMGHDLPTFKTGIQYWNLDYYFKTKEFTKKEFYRMSRAYYAYTYDWKFGATEEDAFEIFLKMTRGRYNRSPYEAKLKDYPKYIHEALKNLTPEQFGYNGWL